MQDLLNREFNTRQRHVSLTCLCLCAVLFCLLGVLPLIPGRITQLFRPVMIALCILTASNGTYRFSSTSWLVVSFADYAITFIAFPMSSNAISSFISIALFIVFCLLVANRDWSRKEIALLLSVTVFACDVQSICLFISNGNLMVMGGSSHLMFFGELTNRNPDSFAIAIGAVAAIFCCLFGKNRMTVFRRFYFMLSAILCTYTVLSLGCRGAFFAMALAMLVLFWEYTKDKSIRNQRAKRILITILLLLLVFLMAYLSQGNYSSRLFSLNEVAEDSGREKLWERAWQLIKEKPLFGGGYDYWSKSGTEMGTHNTLLYVMLCCGAVGGIIFLMCFLSLLIEIIKTKNLIPLAFLSETLFHSYTESNMDYYGYLPLIFTVIILRFIQYKDRDVTHIFDSYKRKS